MNASARRPFPRLRARLLACLLALTTMAPVLVLTAEPAAAEFQNHLMF